MISLQEMLHDPDFCATYQIIRKKSKWVEGEQVSEKITITVEGIALPSTSDEIEMVPEGDRQHGLKTFYAEVPLHITDTKETSDVCVYRGKRYKLLQIFDYRDNGFYKAIGTLVGEADGV